MSTVARKTAPLGKYSPLRGLPLALAVAHTMGLPRPSSWLR